MSLAPGTVRPPSLDAVLAFAWGAGEFTATDVIAETGLTRSTVIEAMDSLASAGLLVELPNARLAGGYRKGRPARRFALRADAAVLVGVDAGVSHITATVTDLRSEPLATHRSTLVGPHREEASERATCISDAIDSALRSAGRSRDEVLSICVGVPAPVNSQGGSPQHPDGFWPRMNPGLVDLLAWAPIAQIDNDASLAAVAEGTLGEAVGCRDYVALLAGERLGAGVVVDGRVLRGRHGGVGEMIAFDHVDGVASAHGLGVRAAAWAAEAVAQGAVNPDGRLAAVPEGRLDGQAVLELAVGGDPDAQAIVERVAAVLARIVSVLGSMFDPQRVVVSGAIAAGLDQVVGAARQLLPTDLHLPAPELVASRLGGDVVVLGAIAAAAAGARERVLDVWRREPDPVSGAD